MLVVDIRDWLIDGEKLPLAPTRLRRNALRIAQLVEYGGPLKAGELRETLVACCRRPGRRPCSGLLWVQKQGDDSIHAHCMVCGRDETTITGWQDTIWAEGMMEPMSSELLDPGRAADLH